MILLVLTVILALIRFVRSDARTATGIAAVSDLRLQRSRISRTPRPEEAPLAVAPFGTAVLVEGRGWGRGWRGESSDSSGEGSSGCGGGCGGCGG